MTDEQKLQWLQNLLNHGVQIGQINLGDGTQNIQVNVQGPSHAPQEEQKASASTTSCAQGNIIFSPRIFTTENHYERLRRSILAFIKQGQNDDDAKYQIDASTQAEWYYILKAIDEARVTRSGKLTDTNFLRQMHSWFPAYFTRKEREVDFEKMLRRYAASISAERSKWMEGMEKTEVSIRDMFAHSNQRGYDPSKTLRLHGVAEGLKKQLEELKLQ